LSGGNLGLIANLLGRHTFLVQVMEGTGFPDALHSRVTDPPLRAVTDPPAGWPLITGGTVDKRAHILLAHSQSGLHNTTQHVKVQLIAKQYTRLLINY